MAKNIYVIQKRKYSYNNPAKGLSKLCSTQLALELGATILTPNEGGIFPEDSLFINWGRSNIPWLKENYNILNHPATVSNAVDKIKSLSLFRENNVLTVPSTQNISVAKGWFNMLDYPTVFCRTLSESSQGKGIVIAKTIDDVVPSKLYTLGIDKKYEYRVHVLKDTIIKVQQKKRLSSDNLKKRGLPKPDGLIRSHSRGYIFANILDHKEDSLLYKSMCTNAIKAVKALDLDFGAVDIIISKHDKVYVLEVNTAPGISGSTLDAYTSAFNKMFNLGINNEQI